MSDQLQPVRLKRVQIQNFVEDDQEAIRALGILVQNVNILIELTQGIEEHLIDLEARVSALEGP